MTNVFQLKPDDHDQLKELVNIGVSHASTSLSQMVGKRMNISVPELAIKNAETSSAFIENPNEITVAVLLHVTGGIDGYVFLLFPRDAAIHLLESISGKTVGDLRALTKFDRSIFQELGNVITGGMLQGLSKFLHCELVHSVPDVVVDMGGAMFNSLSASMISLHEEFLSLEVSVCVNADADSATCDVANEAAGNMYLFIGPDAANAILGITGNITEHKQNG